MHFAQYFTAVVFDCLECQSQRVGDGFAALSCHDLIENFALAWRQASQSRLQGVQTAILPDLLLGIAQAALHLVEQRLFPHWLFQKIHRAFTHGFNGQRYIGVTGNKDHGNRGACVFQPSLHLDATHVGQAQIQHQTEATAQARVVEKLSGVGIVVDRYFQTVQH